MKKRGNHNMNGNRNMNTLQLMRTEGLGMVSSGALALGLAFVAAMVLAPPAQAQTFKVLHAFAGAPNDGQVPWGDLLLHGGILYGTTYGGGANSAGTLFQLSLTTHKETLLYAFAGPDGAKPVSTLLRDSSGNLWGTTAGGGLYGDWGTIFEMSSAGSLSTLYSFQGADGSWPNAALARDSSGNLYSTTYRGAANGYGTIFEFNGALQTLHTFTGGLDGGAPVDHAGLLLLKGRLYGTTFLGGTLDCGTVFEINLATGKEIILYNFTGQADGYEPSASLVTDGKGNLFGTTTGGGSGNGVVFEVNIAARQETVLHTFTGADGAYPYAGVIRDSAGNLYGTTQIGGAAGDGTVWKLDTQGFLTTLYSFTNTTDGEYPIAGLTRDSKGNLYGTASQGGKFGYGTVFEVTP
jgi:uncharacterized repeat protein (TIGR03803 family)